MSALTLAQDVVSEIGLPTISSLVGSTNSTAKRILSYINEIGQDLRSSAQWSELFKEHTITLVSGQDSYSLPADMDRAESTTFWNRSSSLRLINTQSPSKWQEIKSGVATSTIDMARFRIKGWTNSRFFIDPVPGSGDAGSTLVFEYISKTWLRPRSWEASLTFAANSYCSYDGNIYSTVSGGVTGATAPTHTSGSASDGGVVWDYVSDPYERVLADTDEFLFDERLVKLGVKWLYYEHKSLPNARQAFALFEDAKRKRIAGNVPMPKIDLTGGSGTNVNDIQIVAISS